MFEKLNAILETKDALTIRMTKVSDTQIAVSVLPDNTKLSAFTINGEPNEVDDAFIPALKDAIGIVKKFATNLEELEKEAKAKLEANKNKGKTSKVSKEKTEDGSEEDDDDDNEEVTGKIEPPVKTIKLKKTPASVVKYVEKMKNPNEDAQMRDFADKFIRAELAKAKWPDDHIAEFYRVNELYSDSEKMPSTESNQEKTIEAPKSETPIANAPQVNPEVIAPSVINPTIMDGTAGIPDQSNTKDPVDNLPFSVDNNSIIPVNDNPLNINKANHEMEVQNIAESANTTHSQEPPSIDGSDSSNVSSDFDEDLF